MERATEATLQRIVLHGGVLCQRLADEVVAELDAKAHATNALVDAIRDPGFPPARVQKLEEERNRVYAGSQADAKQQAFEDLSDLVRRAITLRRERGEIFAVPAPAPDSGGNLPPLPNPPHKDEWVRVPAEQPKRPFWRRLFGGR